MARFAPLLLMLFLLAGQAHAQAVHRCVDPSGRSVYSDQPCDSLGAVARAAPRPSPVGNVQGFTTGTGTVAAGCARSLDALLMNVRGALEARDVNRLATHYHWPGTSARGGRYLMDELEEIARRPLVAVELVYTEPEVAAWPAEFEFGPASEAGAVDRAGEKASGLKPLLQGGNERPRPRGLRVEQASGPNDAGAVRTDFLLRRHAGCWWIEL